MRVMSPSKLDPQTVIKKTEKLLHVTPDEEEEETPMKKGMPFMTMVSASYAPE